ncbi:MAG: GTP-binding protein [Candidatus Helarchaeota archaeon]|nr:GTP-binding protein [Candidatus Helarchaeota archaeon]
MPTTDKKLAFKIVVIGDPAVGKTSLIRRFSENKFDTSYLPTIGADFNLKVIELPDAQVIMTVWDIGGHEKFQSIRAFYYSGAHGGIIAFDLTREETFKNVKQWAEDILTGAGEKIPLVLICNKSDLTDQIVVNEEDIKKLAEELDVTYFMTSAKSGLNVQDPFQKLAVDCAQFFSK